MTEGAVGAALAEARLAAGLTLDQVAERTKIRASLLAAMEAGNFGICGGTVYAKGHLRNVAAAIGIDPAPLVAQLEPGDVETSPAIEAVSSSLGARDVLLRRGNRRRPRGAAVGAGAVAVVAALAAASYLGGGEGAGPTPAHAPVVAPTPAAQAGPPASSAGAAVPAGAVVPSPNPPGGVNVTVHVTGDSSWVGQYASGSGALEFQGILAEGTTKVFSAADSVHLTIGKPEAVKVLVNGKNVGSPGTPGRPADVTYTPTGQTTAPGG